MTNQFFLRRVSLDLYGSVLVCSQSLEGIILGIYKYNVMASRDLKSYKSRSLSAAEKYKLTNCGWIESEIRQNLEVNITSNAL